MGMVRTLLLEQLLRERQQLRAWICERMIALGIWPYAPTLLRNSLLPPPQGLPPRPPTSASISDNADQESASNSERGEQREESGTNGCDADSEVNGSDAVSGSNGSDNEASEGRCEDSSEDQEAVTVADDDNEATFCNGKYESASSEDAPLLTPMMDEEDGESASNNEQGIPQLIPITEDEDEELSSNTQDEQKED